MSETSGSGPVDRTVGRQCTCHPDDSPPVPCAERYALTDCKAAAHDRLRAEVEALRAALQCFPENPNPYTYRMAYAAAPKLLTPNAVVSRAAETPGDA